MSKAILGYGIRVDDASVTRDHLGRLPWEIVDDYGICDTDPWYLLDGKGSPLILEASDGAHMLLCRVSCLMSTDTMELTGTQLRNLYDETNIGAYEGVIHDMVNGFNLSDALIPQVHLFTID